MCLRRNKRSKRSVSHINWKARLVSLKSQLRPSLPGPCPGTPSSGGKPSQNNGACIWCLPSSVGQNPFQHRDSEIARLQWLLVMRRKRLSAKASNRTPFLTTRIPKSFTRWLALGKSNHLRAIPIRRPFWNKCLGFFFFCSEEFINHTKKKKNCLRPPISFEWDLSIRIQSERPAFTYKTKPPTSRILSNWVNAQ